MNEEIYTGNKIEVSLTEAIERAKEQQEERRRVQRAAEAAELESVEEIPEGKKLTWKVTPEEIARINAGNRVALDAFYFQEENFKRITFSALSFMRHSQFLKSVISAEDLVQQAYLDLALGLAKLRPYDGAISKTIFNSFRFAAVGGIDEIFVP